VIVSNAGVGMGGALRLIHPDAVAAALNVNLTGNWRTIHAALPHIIERRGYVVGVTSAAAIAPTPGLGPYCASKAGLEMLLDVLRVEVAHLGVDVGVAYFLWIDTDMVRGAEREMPAFRELREGRPAFLRKVHPVGAAADAIVGGITERSRRIYTPGWLAALSPARMALRSPIAEREALKGVRIVDEQTALQVGEKGARDAASRRTKAGDAALASVERGASAKSGRD
jgi:NAD(P)-dependent dehydrogenase (short-subunit alcohol dehydrogenase family)